MSSEWAEQPANTDNHGVPGRTLAAQREAMGWTVEQVADQLKLAVRQVVALEAGDYAALPGPAVVRGFVRAYAKIVKLDPIPLVAQISMETPGPTDATGTVVRREAKPASFSEVRFPTHGKRTPFPIVPIGALVVVIAAAAAAWHFDLPRLLTRTDAPAASSPGAAVLQPNLSTLPAPLSPGPAGAPAAPATSSVQVNSLQNPSVPLISVPPPSSTAAGSPSAGVAPAAPAATPAAAPGANALVVTVREDSWLEVRRAQGAPLIARLVKGGTTQSFEVTEPVTLVVGKPGAVSVTLRGAAVALPPVPGSAVSRVNLK